MNKLLSKFIDKISIKGILATILFPILFTVSYFMSGFVIYSYNWLKVDSPSYCSTKALVPYIGNMHFGSEVEGRYAGRYIAEGCNYLCTSYKQIHLFPIELPYILTIIAGICLAVSIYSIIETIRRINQNEY